MSTAQRFAWLDAVSTLAMCGAAILAVPPAGGQSLWGILAGVLLVTGVCIVAFYYNDLYDFEAPHDVAELFRRLCRALGAAALALAGAYVVAPGVVLGGTLASHALLLILGGVLALRVAAYALAKRAPFSERVLIVGSSPLAAELTRVIRTRPDLPLRVVGVCGDEGAAVDAPRVGDYEALPDLVRRLRPDRIVVTMPDRRHRLPVEALLAARVRGIAVEEGTHMFERFTHRLAVESLTPSALIFGDGFRVTRTRLAAKRVMSVAFATVALVLTAPLMALIAAAVRLESPGPALFVQERVGLHGRRFRCFKFRTMRQGSEDDGSIWERDNASRVTRLGAVLRRYRLDELPQFWNILRGDMSLVGPRPEMASNVDTFSAVIPYYSLRHEVRPGLTGWAQVRAGYSMSTEEVTRKLCYDLYYIKHLSLAFDLRILFDTVKFVLSGTRPG
ncbi:MAG TPA: sugar transferase [Candidatus Tectomicrobia bacterium]|nr:sugar transferase [Candidatus Tectomicrobia bacterium]